MLIASFPTLFLALLLAGPAIWHAAVVRDLDPLTALIRYLIAIPVAAIMLGLVRAITTGYERYNNSPLRVTAVTGTPIASGPKAPVPGTSMEPPAGTPPV
jgi:hypothetical protein